MQQFIAQQTGTPNMPKNTGAHSTKNSNKTQFVQEFSSVLSGKIKEEEKKSKNPAPSKNIMLPSNRNQSGDNGDDLTPKGSTFYLPEYVNEQVLMEIIDKIGTLEDNLSQLKGLWREKIIFLKNLASVLPLFNLPELYDSLG